MDDEVLISQYADDTTFFLDGSKQSFLECIRVLKLYAAYSGLKINFDKSTVVWIGSCKFSNQKFLPDINLQWNPSTFKVLGVTFSVIEKEIASLNFDEKINDIQKLLAGWSKRNLTPFGKIVVKKTLAIPKLTHLLMNLPDARDYFFNTINSIFFME